jgi:hypothetical protein
MYVLALVKEPLPMTVLELLRLVVPVKFGKLMVARKERSSR